MGEPVERVFLAVELSCPVGRRRSHAIDQKRDTGRSPNRASHHDHRVGGRNDGLAIRFEHPPPITSAQPPLVGWALTLICAGRG